MLTDKLRARARHGRRGRVRRRQLVPHAPRRRPVAPAQRGPRHARGRDPARADRAMTDAARPFPEAAREALADAQLRRNLRTATTTIREKRAAVVAERDDWEALREAGRRIKAQAVRHLDRHLEDLERVGDRARRRRALGPRRRGGQRDRGGDRPRGRRRRGHQGQVAGHRRDRAQRRAGRSTASRRWRPTWPSSSTSSRTTAPRTSSSPRSTATARRSPRSSAATCPARRASGPTRRS